MKERGREGERSNVMGKEGGERGKKIERERERKKATINPKKMTPKA